MPAALTTAPTCPTTLLAQRVRRIAAALILDESVQEGADRFADAWQVSLAVGDAAQPLMALPCPRDLSRFYCDAYRAATRRLLRAMLRGHDIDTVPEALAERLILVHPNMGVGEAIRSWHLLMFVPSDRTALRGGLVLLRDMGRVLDDPDGTAAHALAGQWRADVARIARAGLEVAHAVC